MASNQQWVGAGTGALSGAGTGAMVGGPWGAAAGGVIGGVLGFLGSGDDGSEQMMQTIQQNLDELTALGMPPETAKEVLMQKYKVSGQLTPELEEALPKMISKVAELQENPQNRQNQVYALNKLKSQSSSGLTAEDRLALNTQRKEAETDARAKQASIQQNAQMAGLGTSGAALIGSMSAAQSADQQRAEAGDRTSAMSLQTSRDALKEYLSGITNLRNTDWSIQKTKADAEDINNRFFLENSASTQARNVAAKNRANQTMFQMQNEADWKNVAQHNQEQQRQNQARLDDWNAKLNYQNSINNTRMGQNNIIAQQAANNNQMWSNMGNAAIGAGTSYASYKNNQDWLDAYKKSKGLS